MKVIRGNKILLPPSNDCPPSGHRFRCANNMCGAELETEENEPAIKCVHSEKDEGFTGAFNKMIQNSGWYVSCPVCGFTHNFIKDWARKKWEDENPSKLEKHQNEIVEFRKIEAQY